MAKPLYIAGTGEFAAEIASWAAESGREVTGLIEMRQETRIGSMLHGLPVIDPGERPKGGAALIGLGGNRAENWGPLAESGWTPAEALIHPGASLASSARLAPGATVGPMAVIGAESTIGEHALVSRGALIGHHVTVEGFSILGPGVAVGGRTKVGATTFLGIGAVVSDSIEIGAGALVAAGAVVVSDVPAGARVQGVPAKPSR